MTLRFAAPIDALFPALALPEAIAAAKDAGFDGVEIPFPYDGPATQTRTALIFAGVELVLIHAPPPNWTGGPRGFAAVPGLEDRFLRDLDRALRFAGVLKPRHLCLLPGAAEGAAARAVFVENLRRATARAPKLSFLIEPLPPETAEGWFLTGYGQAADLIAEVGAPNLGLIFDPGHAGRITGDAMACWQDVAPLVRHVRIATPPGATVTTEAQALLDRLARDGYRGFVGGGHRPGTPLAAAPVG